MHLELDSPAARRARPALPLWFWVALALLGFGSGAAWSLLGLPPYRVADAPTLRTAPAPAALVTREVASGAQPLPAAAPAPAAAPPAIDYDEALRAKLLAGAIVAVKKGSGGRTLAFKLTLDSGVQAYFKPEQSVSSAHWYSEVAAYHLDRALGLNRVPTLVSRALPWSELRAAAGGDWRVPQLAIRKGMLRGALIYWLPEHLVPARTPPGWENWLTVQPFSPTKVSPYQSSTDLRAALARARELAQAHEPPDVFFHSVPSPDDPDLPAALSDMIIFDFLTLNYDRFGSDNVNVLLRGPHGPLIFLDNGDGFSAGPPRRHLLDRRLAPLARFRKRTIDALRALDVKAFAARLAQEPLAPVLDARALAGLAVRRQVVLEHVAAQQKRYGDVVYAW